MWVSWSGTDEGNVDDEDEDDEDDHEEHQIELHPIEDDNAGDEILQSEDE